MFDPATRMWQHVAPMHQARRYHSVAVLDRQLYAVGGYDGSHVLDAVEAYDPRSNQWSKSTLDYMHICVMYLCL